MKTTLSLMALALATTPSAQAGNAVHDGAMVANFAAVVETGDEPGFEQLSFWSGPGGQQVDYFYGADHKRVRLHALGHNAAHRSFAIRFPNGLVLDVAPRKDALLVSDRSGKYRRRFVWLYEGPRDGRGTYCAACVPQGLAISFVRENFMQSASTM